ncbi:hypothetical protein ACLB2K_076172 [Fragaria x ananassa]
MDGCTAHPDRGRLAFIRLHGDTRWTYIDAGIIERVYEIIYAEDKLYALDSKNRGFSCDITTTSQLNFTLVAETFEDVGLFMLKTYLVESSEGLVMVIRYMRTSQRRHRPRLTVGFIVFKLDAYHRKWAPIDTLGDVALFLGDSVISVMASDFPGSVPPIYHHDVKSSNILLDYKLNAKVADFGLSRLAHTDTSHISTCAQGTLGYLDPEYYRNYQLTDKSDVYSFGVVLLELMSSQIAIDFNRDADDVNLAVYVQRLMAEEKLIDAIDPMLKEGATALELDTMKALGFLALGCLEERRQNRPSMKEVVEEIEYITSIATSKVVDD